MKKRILAGSLALFLFAVSGGAFAFIALIPGIVPLATYLGASAELATAIDFSLALHAGILAIALNKNGGAATSHTSAPITVRINPKSPLPTPSGWTPPAAGSIKPTPPTPLSQVGGWTSDGVVYGSADEAARHFIAVHYSAWVYESYSLATDASGQYANALIHDNPPYQSSYQTIGHVATLSVTCPVGYSVSGSSCALTNADLVRKPSDGNCQIVRTGNAYAVDPLDPDCDSGSPSLSGLNNGQGTITATNPDGRKVTVKINGDGTTTVREQYPDAANNRTRILDTGFGPPDSSTGDVPLEKIQQTDYPGLGDYPLPDSGVPAAPTFDTTGLARDATLNQILGKATTSDASLTTIKDKVTNSDTTLTTIKDSAASAVANLKDIKDALTATSSAIAAENLAASGISGTPYSPGIISTITGWFPESTSAATGTDGESLRDAVSVVPLPVATACMPLVLTPLVGHAPVTFDWCGVVTAVQPVINWGVNIMAALYAMGVVFSVSSPKKA